MNEEQEREFREIFTDKRNGIREIVTANDIEAFINHLLNNEREEIAKEIEKGKEKMLGYNHPHDIIYRAATIARSRITKSIT